MGINISMTIFKNPKFKSQFDEIKNRIYKDYEEYVESLPKKYFDESGEYVGSESFCPKFYDHYDEYGEIKIITGIFSGEIAIYIMEFWEKISKKYFPEEFMVIDEPGISYVVHKSYKYNILEEENTSGIIADVLRKYNKPFQF